MRVKSSGMARGLANAPPPGSAKSTNAPGTDKAGKYPAVARGGGWAQVELTDALEKIENVLCRTFTYDA